MKIVTWNINGLRAVSQKGFDEWLGKNLPDIVGLQEIKAKEDQVQPQMLKWQENYQVFLHPAKRPGYSGTALFIKNTGPKPIKINYGIGDDQYDDEGRLIWAEFEDFFLFCGYFPNGKDDLSRVDYKLDFTKRVLTLALECSKSKGVLVMGDLNTAHQEIDIARPRANMKKTGFLPIERAMLTHMEDSGLKDAFRIKHPEARDEYTWWTYRGGCREKNIGWRLDYFFIDSKIESRLVSIKHQQDVLGSDHCPVEIVFN